MADPVENPEPEQDIDRRVASLETGQENLSQKLDKILGIMGGGDDHDAEGSGQDGQPGGTNIAHEIRQQLDARDRENKEQAEKDGLKNELGEVKAKLSELTEKPPAPMPRRVEKLMGWS
jgi:hypothetical protein